MNYEYMVSGQHTMIELLFAPCVDYTIHLKSFVYFGYKQVKRIVKRGGVKTARNGQVHVFTVKN